MMAVAKERRSRIPILVWLLVPAGLLIFAGANAHLVYVAVTSQPDCIAHLKERGSGHSQYRAAKSSC